jgi:DNA-binding CsgD family transcriptional regulator
VLPGLAEDDAEVLHRAVSAYARGSRPLELALASEEAGTAFARQGDTDRARPLLEQAIGIYERLEAARDLAPRRGSAARGGYRPQTGWDSLTPTEHTVADLVAKGLSNPQIGERLYISRRTVQAHLAHVLPSWTSLPARSLLPRSPSGSGRRHSGRRAGSAVCAGPPWPDRLVSVVRLAAFAEPGTDGCRPVRLARSRRRRARQPRVLTIYMQPAWGSAFTRAGT